MRLPSRSFYSSALWAILPSFGIASLAMRAAWQDNNNGEFHNDTSIEWVNWIGGVGIPWFLLSQAVLSLLIFSIRRIFQKLKGH